MTVRFEAVVFGVADPGGVGAFWGALLGREVVAEAGGVFVPGDDTQVGLRFVGSAGEVGVQRLHLHLTSGSAAEQERTVEAAVGLGARRSDVGLEDPHVVLADPGGDEFCVIEAGNRFLEGCGFLGEVTCGGSRQVGFFWRDVLGWPLVWDEGEQTAIQSPAGGTKISWDVWDGPDHGLSRQRFDLVAADPGDEVERLVALGATRLREVTDGVELADPDGREFRLRGSAL